LWAWDSREKADPSHSFGMTTKPAFMPLAAVIPNAVAGVWRTRRDLLFGVEVIDSGEGAVQPGPPTWDCAVRIRRIFFSRRQALISFFASDGILNVAEGFEVDEAENPGSEW